MTKSQKKGGENMRTNFAAARINAGLSQAEVGRRLGVDQSTVSYWESGKKFPRGATLVKLADLYCRTIGELMGRDSA